MFTLSEINMYYRISHWFRLGFTTNGISKNLLVFRDFQISELSIKDYRHVQMAQILGKIVNLLIIKDIQIKTIKVPIFSLQMNKYIFQRKSQQCEKWVLWPLLWEPKLGQLSSHQYWCHQCVKNTNTFDPKNAFSGTHFLGSHQYLDKASHLDVHWNREF